MDPGEHAAFHGAPGDGVAPLRARLAEEGRDAERARLTWLLGVCLGASGRYGEAFALLEPAAGPEGSDLALITEGAGTAYPSLMASTLGSLHRQLTHYETARGHDERAVRLAGLVTSGSDADARVDAHLGLAADAVGLNQPATAQRHWERAHAVLDDPSGPDDGPGWRVRVRASWVQAEISLLRGEPKGARAPAGEAVRLSQAARAPRHSVKSRLFSIVSHLPDTSYPVRQSLGRAFGEADRLGCPMLLWPAGKLLLEALASELRDQERVRIARKTHAAVDAIRSSLPEPVGTAWAATTGLSGRPAAVGVL